MSNNLIIKKLLAGSYDFNKRLLLNRKIKAILKSQCGKSKLTEPDKALICRHKELWRRLSRRVNPAWLRVYGNISGIWDYRYIPESLYYTIVEPCLNDKSFSKAYTDKNFYSFILPNFKGPGLIISNINGLFYNCDSELMDFNEVSALLLDSDKFIIKPSIDSGGGKGVSLMTRHGAVFTSETGESFSPDDLLKRYNKNYIIQDLVEQHPYYSRFNSTSLNTVRVLTYRSFTDNSVYILHSVFRIGRSGQITDNQASGGFACGLTDDGLLTGKAVDKYGNRYDDVNGIRLIKGEKPEGIEIIYKMAKEIAEKFHYSRLLGLDLCLDAEGQCRVIEVNNVNNEINFFQMTGGPLFKRFTEEVVSYTLSHKRTFMVDFEI
jgi:hypothetical protein